ncbi:Mfa1 family fimbria major subunit [Parabacteroides sp. PF5-6]|uniref:Mfa1 family fimbria major subunit n=1 Tax=Parabacteroides sp. PF5-6 TaxID=1742403 RepID=UPI002404BAFC|nr:Mfa1 family fimbria major subunit [Parabacteroides sp. PF5-6]MDF9830789.1 hypothetical protein [Parabacteroides sp. PF5-6]
MRFKNILNIIGIVVALGLWGTSCVEESGVEGSGQPAPEGEAYLSLKVKTGDLSAFTRGEEVLGSADELAVHSVRVVLYDGNENSATKCKVEYVFEYNLETPEGWTDTSDPTLWIDEKEDADEVDPKGLFIIPSGNHLSPEYREGYEFATFAQRVKDKPYKMLVILNGQDKDNSFESAVYKATNKGNFLYNFTTAVAATIDPQTGVLIDGKGILMTNHQGLVEVTKDQLTRTATESHKAPIAVSVDRLVAKVTVKHADGFQFPPGIDENSVTWGLDITNNFTHWMRKETTGESYDPTMETLYAQDPNYGMFTEDKDKADHFNSLFVNDKGALHLPSAHVGHSLGEYKYVLENTIDAKGESLSEYADQITRLIVGYKYKPMGYNGTENYYIYQNTVISQEELNRILTDPTFTLPGLTNFKETLALIEEEGKYKLDGKGTDYFETYGLRYCPQGQLYYIIPIQHFGGSGTALGCYGVVRNNIYEITINKLTPPEVAGPHLSADIHIQPWAQRSQGNTIGSTDIYEVKWHPVKVYHWFIRDYSNLYQQWISRKISGRNDEYEIIMVKEGRKVQETMINRQADFNADLPNHSQLLFIYSVPALDYTVTGDPEKDVLHAFYIEGYVTGFLNVPVNVCFTKADGTILRIEGRHPSDGTAHYANPYTYHMTYLRVPTDETKGYAFVKQLVSKYEISIFDEYNREYVVTSNEICNYYYKIPITSSTHVEWDPNHPASGEPAFVASGSGGNISGNGNLGVALICVPK